MRKLNYKKTTSDNSKGRSCQSTYKHLSKPGLADKVKQSFYGIMVFMGLTVGTCSVADSVFGSERTLDKNIFSSYNNTVAQKDSIPFYLKHYNSKQTTNNYLNNSNFIIPDTIPSQPKKQFAALIEPTKLDVDSTEELSCNITQEKNMSQNSSNDNSAEQKVKKHNKDKKSSNHKRNFVQHGIASHMGHSLHGKKQASGERHNKNEMICAHKSLPFGTLIRVTNIKTGQSVVVRVTDRGPFGPGRVVDLSLAAAKKISIEKSGICKVKVETL